VIENLIGKLEFLVRKHGIILPQPQSGAEPAREEAVSAEAPQKKIAREEPSKVI
jgi:hypothetical protein